MFEIENGRFVGTVDWEGPGEVKLDMEDPGERSWFEDYFSAEDSYLGGAVGSEVMSCERRDSSEEAFNRAMFGLAAYAYKVRTGVGNRRPAHSKKSDA